MKNIMFGHFVLSTSALALCAHGAAHAQEDAAPEAGARKLNTVVVSAQRKSEDLQDIPVTVSAASAEQLAASGVVSIQDLGVLAPGLSLTAQSGSNTIYLRGVGNNNNSAGQEQNVALYIDGVYYPSMSADLGAFKSIDRIEVIKGPQGTLFGRNTTGGLIQVITRDPTDEFSGDVSLGYGNFSTITANGYFAGSFNDTLAADISLNYKDQGKGYGNNIVTGADANFAEAFDARTKWVITPNDRTKVTLVAAYSDLETDFGVAWNAVSTTPASPIFGNAAQTGSFWDSNPNSFSLVETEQTSVNAKIEHEFDAFKFTSLTAYQETERLTNFDLDFTAADLVSAIFPSVDESFSQEFQIASLPDAPFSWIGGVQYYGAEATQDTLEIQSAGLTVASFDYKQDTTSYAAFGQATFPLGEKFNLTLGGRYTYEEKELTDSTLGALTPGGFFTFDAFGSEDWTNFSYKVSLDYDVAEDVLLFATVSTGFKSGLYNTLFAPGENQPVEPEELTSYEVGLKSELFDNRARLNVSAFFYDYEDLQFQTFTGTSSILANAPAAEVLGAEAELSVALTDSLDGRVGVSVLDTEFTESFITVTNPTGPLGAGVAGGVDAQGNQLQRTPDYTFDVGLNHTLETELGSFDTNVTYYYNDGFFWETDNILEQESYSVVNASVLWTVPDGGFNVRFWGKNIFEEEYANSAVSGDGSVASFTPAPPATYGVTIGTSF